MMNDHPGRLRDAQEAYFQKRGHRETLIGGFLHSIFGAERREAEIAVRDALRRRLQRNGGAQ